MKEIDDFPNYLIDENGNIFSIKSKKLISTFIDGTHNVKKVTLFKDGKEYKKLIHHLVAIAYIPKTGTIVIHKDGNKLNNNCANLEWSKRKLKNNENN